MQEYICRNAHASIKMSIKKKCRMELIREIWYSSLSTIQERYEI